MPSPYGKVRQGKNKLTSFVLCNDDQQEIGPHCRQGAADNMKVQHLPHK